MWRTWPTGIRNCKVELARLVPELRRDSRSARSSCSNGSRAPLYTIGVRHFWRPPPSSSWGLCSWWSVVDSRAASSMGRKRSGPTASRRVSPATPRIRRSSRSSAPSEAMNRSTTSNALRATHSLPSGKTRASRAWHFPTTCRCPCKRECGTSTHAPRSHSSRFEGPSRKRSRRTRASVGAFGRPTRRSNARAAFPSSTTSTRPSKRMSSTPSSSPFRSR